MYKEVPVLLLRTVSAATNMDLTMRDLEVIQAVRCLFGLSSNRASDTSARNTAIPGYREGSATFSLSITFHFSIK